MTQQTDNRTNGNSPAVAGAEPDSSGQSALDKLLSEYKAGTQTPAEPASMAALKALEPVIQFAEGERQSRIKEAFDAEVKSAVDYLTESEEAKAVPARFTRGYLDAYAVENPAFKAAFETRQADPAGWKAALGKCRDAFNEDIKGLTGNKLRTEVEAARAAAAGQSTQQAAPAGAKSSQELRKMNDREFAAYKLELGARAGAP